METDAATIAAGLTAAQRSCLRQCIHGWFVASNLTDTRLATMRRILAQLRRLTLLESADDEFKSERRKYRLTPLGLAVRRELERNGK